MKKLPQPPLANFIGFPQEALERGELMRRAGPPRLRKYVERVLHMSSGHRGTYMYVVEKGWWVWNTQRAVMVEFRDAEPFAGYRERLYGLEKRKTTMD